MPFPECYLGIERRPGTRVRGGYTPHRHEKSAEALDSKGFRRCPLRKGVRKPNKKQDLLRSEHAAQAHHFTCRNEATPPPKCMNIKMKDLLEGHFINY